MSEVESEAMRDAQEWSMIELAHRILEAQGTAMSFRDLFARIAELKGLSPEAHDRWLVQFYTDLNTDGRFVSLSDGEWGLKPWYPTEQYEDGAAYLALVGDELEEDIDAFDVDEGDEDALLDETGEDDPLSFDEALDEALIDEDLEPDGTLDEYTALDESSVEEPLDDEALAEDEEND
ncbi:MAG: DNA-directed RNA polymerase subunit delta [Hydrogenibacillus sp.]|nr:DNA-directed RNA polymerase subunit delta [Hydrogenibacillus sp.]